MVSGVLRGNGGVGRGEVFVGEDIGVGEVVERAAVDGKGDLDFGFVGCAIDESCAAVWHFQSVVWGKPWGQKVQNDSHEQIL